MMGIEGALTHSNMLVLKHCTIIFIAQLELHIQWIPPSVLYGFIIIGVLANAFCKG